MKSELGHGVGERGGKRERELLRQYFNDLLTLFYAAILKFPGLDM
jgi:hypothetical protein